MQTAGNEPFRVSVLAGSVWHDFRRAWGKLIVFEVLFKLLEAWLLVPALALLLSLLLSHAGHVAVSNRDVVDFLLSPSGLLYAALQRVAGVPRRIEEISHDEIRKLDVGSWFDAAFAGERVPTLAEIINLSRGRIKLNIEMKFFGPERGLTRAVAHLVRAQDFESHCLVTSFNYDALQEAKRDNPRLRTGLIVAHALGNISRLEVEALSVRADFLSDELLREAHRAGQEVHVWTVNDEREMVRLLKRGVDNILTSDPDRGVRVRQEWASLTETERLGLASRLLLGLNP